MLKKQIKELKKMTELTIEQLFEHAKAAVRNAEALLIEAQLLHDNGYYARAFFLAYTAFEEVAKAQITISQGFSLIAEEPIPWKEFQKRRTNHGTKFISLIISPLLVGKAPADAVKLMREKFATLESLMESRQKALYVDLKENKTITPEVFEEKNSHRMIAMAKSYFQLASQKINNETIEQMFIKRRQRKNKEKPRSNYAALLRTSRRDEKNEPLKYQIKKRLKLRTQNPT